MIAATFVSLVSRNVEVGGGTVAAISVISGSGIGPGPLGMAATNPTASAPCRTARRASSTVAMQHTFTRVRRCGVILLLS